MLLDKVAKITDFEIEAYGSIVKSCGIRVSGLPSLFHVGSACWEWKDALNNKTMHQLWEDAAIAVTETWNIEVINPISGSIKKIIVGEKSCVVTFCCLKEGLRIDGGAMISLPGWFDKLSDEIEYFIDSKSQSWPID